MLWKYQRKCIALTTSGDLKGIAPISSATNGPTCQSFDFLKKTHHPCGRQWLSGSLQELSAVSSPAALPESTRMPFTREDIVYYLCSSLNTHPLLFSNNMLSYSTVQGALLESVCLLYVYAYIICSAYIVSHMIGSLCRFSLTWTYFNMVTWKDQLMFCPFKSFFLFSIVNRKLCKIQEKVRNKSVLTECVRKLLKRKRGKRYTVQTEAFFGSRNLISNSQNKFPNHYSVDTNTEPTTHTFYAPSFIMTQNYSVS